MENKQENKGELLASISVSFADLKAENSKGAYTPDPEKIASMARRIALKAKQDPTRLASQTIEDLLS